MPAPAAALLSIGDELTLGQSVDSNSAWIADRLLDLGVRVIEHATVEDDSVAMAAAFRRLAGAADLLICTGGLGPTADDLTRQVLAEHLDSRLVEDAGSLTRIEQWAVGRGGLPAINRVEALRPESGESLENLHGTAPGLRARDARQGTEIFCLPGPPHEMKPMFERFVAPFAMALTNAVTRTRLLLTFGLGESRIAELLGPLMDRSRETHRLALVGTTASDGVVTCRIRAEGPDERAADRLIDEAEREIMSRLEAAGVDKIIFDRRDGASANQTSTNALPAAVVALLRDRNERLAVVESCTGGMLGSAITAIPGSSEVFAGGWLTYSNAMKSALVGVPEKIIKAHGAVSAECAIAMAAGALDRLDQTAESCVHALSITGVAGPGGGSDDKPVGTVWIAAATRRDGKKSAEARRFKFSGDRDRIRIRSVQAALGILRLRMLGLDMELLWEAERRN